MVRTSISPEYVSCNPVNRYAIRPINFTIDYDFFAYRQTTIMLQRNPSSSSSLSQQKQESLAMRPIYGCPEKFRESSQTPPATFPEICKRLLFRSILRMCVQNLKFVALSVPEIIGGTQKIWAVPVYAHAPVSSKFLIGFCLYGPSEYICQI